MATAKFYVRDYGTPRIVGNRLIGNGKQTETTDIIMREIVADLMVQTKKQFDSGGRRRGSWRALKEATVKKKGHETILKTIPMNAKYEKPSIDHDALYRSVTEPGARYQYMKITKTGFQFGTSRPMAGVHQRGGGRVPPRPFLFALPSDEDRWKGMIARHMTKFTQKTNPIGTDK